MNVASYARGEKPAVFQEARPELARTVSRPRPNPATYATAVEVYRSSLWGRLYRILFTTSLADQ